ncbi:MAG: nickel-dependent hydrogenase large subunit [Planctomycetes bacterium]|nr:nickel-dependent hydrogenase large subunit [Planctomycetota bacterium]
MTQHIAIDPVTRIEGHLSVKVELEGQKVSQAYCRGDMFRGFEVILKGRDPLEAQHITQRICGVCPVSHGTASVLAQDEAYGITTPDNGRIIRNMILGANFIQSHLLHFYHLSAIDFVDITAITKYTGGDPMLRQVKAWVQEQMASEILFPAAPFLPRYEGKYIENNELNFLALKHYLQGFEMRALAHKMGAIFAGKLPHAASLTPGGVTEKATARKIASYQSILDQLRTFIRESYIADIVEIAKVFPEYLSIGKGCGNFLAYGAFPEAAGNQSLFLPGGIVTRGKAEVFNPQMITEDVGYSRFSSTSGLHPTTSQTIADPGKDQAYSWIKAPRYAGKVMEVGPLARMLVAYYQGTNQAVTDAVDGLLSKINGKIENLNSILGRHAARALECLVVADRCAEWLELLRPDQPTFVDFQIPESAEGMGLTEAPRGALGHWLQIENQRIKRYQCIVPTSWNCSPRDDNSRPGAVEQALAGTPIANSEHPIEAVRVIRSFDPCLACAVH